MHGRTLWLALAIFSILGANVPPAEGQSTSIYYRAEIAFKVDSLARTAPRPVNSAEVKAIRTFVANPFTASPPTVEQLNAAYEIAKKAHDKQEEGEGEKPFNLFGGGGSAANILGGLPSQAELIQGLANFMVRRAQNELVFAFVDNLRIRIQGNAVVEALMPSSYAILQAIEPASFQVLLPQLRTAAEADLRAIPHRAAEPAVLNALNLQGNRRHAVQAASIVFERVKEMRGGAHPATALANLRDLDSQSLGSEKLRTPLVLVGLVSREYSVHADSLRNVMDVLGKRQVFARYLAEDLIARVGVAAEAARIRQMVEARQADLQQLVEELHQIDARVIAARAAFDEGAKASAAAAAIDAAVVLLGSARRYLTDSSVSTSFVSLVEGARSLNEAWVKRDYSFMVGWLIAQLNVEQQPQNSVRTKALRYISFAASLASAQDAEQVTVALRTAAGPVGSYRLKRRQDDTETRPVAFFITGFVGATAGYEHARPDSAGRGGGAAHFGPAVPVGFEAAWPKKNGSLSLFVPLIDLGTLASVRAFGGDDVEQTAELGFEQVLAPGIYGVWGIGGNTPTVLGFGIQSTPGLRRPSGSGSALDVWRLSVFFGIDVTLLRL